MLRRCIALALAACLLAVDDGALAQLDVGEDCTLALPAPARPAASAPPPALAAIPRGRALGAIETTRCHEMLRDRSIPFDALEATPGVSEPVRVRGEIGAGLVVRSQGAEPRARGGRVAVDHRFDATFDCRLVLALHAWAPLLREAGFVAIEHVSVYRPRARVAATGRVSGHAHGLAIDLLALVRADGTRFTILDDWTVRDRGAEPCAPREEPTEQAAVRRAVCRGVAEGLFQVVITPHHDDRHANHVHLEVRPGVDWAIAR